MDISTYIGEFENKNHRYKPYSKIYKTVLSGGKPYSLNSQSGFEESEYLHLNIRECVKTYTSNKDTAIALFRDFVSFLGTKGVDVHVVFPPIPVSNTFERLMFIAKYLQEKENHISDLPDILWISSRQIEADLARLRGLDDPIQVCGRKFFIPDTHRQDGRITFQSTAHPVFLTENLTQILILLKGLKVMSENPLYKPYAIESAKEIWNQLSTYARDRIRVVLQELMPEDYSWYGSLSDQYDGNSFQTEEAVSRIHNAGANVLLDCLKNGKSFCMEYQTDEGIHYYNDCQIPLGSYQAGAGGILVITSGGEIKIKIDRVIRSAYTEEELIAD